MAVRSPIAIKADRSAMPMVVTTRGRARVGLAFKAVSLRPCFGRDSSVLPGRTFQPASCFSPVAGLKRSESRSEGADVVVHARQSLPDVGPLAILP